jgi:hypothetical protein
VAEKGRLDVADPTTGDDSAHLRLPQFQSGTYMAETLPDVQPTGVRRAAIGSPKIVDDVEGLPA